MYNKKIITPVSLKLQHKNLPLLDGNGHSKGLKWCFKPDESYYSFKNSHTVKTTRLTFPKFQMMLSAPWHHWDHLGTGLILVTSWSTFATFVPQYQLCPLCFESNQRPTNCLTTPRKMQCIESIPIPVTMSKLGSPNKGLGALSPNTCTYTIIIIITTIIINSTFF